MNYICPTITASDNHDYRRQMETVLPFSKRIHIDLMDGLFAPTRSLPISALWWPDNLIVDIHMMYERPDEQLDLLISLKPSLIIVHFEAQSELSKLATRLHEANIKAGLALMPATSVEQAADVLEQFDHALVFGGRLGYHGGSADLSQLDKVRDLKSRLPAMELSWDGGVNLENAKTITESGVSVLNAGSYIHSADDPRSAYAKLESAVNA